MDMLCRTAEHRRLGDDAWRQWGPYLSERQWGTVREDHSPDGNWFVLWSMFVVRGCIMAALLLLMIIAYSLPYFKIICHDVLQPLHILLTFFMSTMYT